MERYYHHYAFRKNGSVTSIPSFLSGGVWQECGRVAQVFFSKSLFSTISSSEASVRAGFTRWRSDTRKFDLYIYSSTADLSWVLSRWKKDLSTVSLRYIVDTFVMIFMYMCLFFSFIFSLEGSVWVVGKLIDILVEKEVVNRMRYIFVPGSSDVEWFGEERIC